ncbi:rhodanese-like domain-containing protein [Bacillus sp. AFS041924]|uniref:rhodanese-like domain-containing protein n=1 Tax=Bacillus sp. AFS041924 TaxID=2033503 RepID=UPI000BFE8D95|nr:rhodanese-like domain-containing protein [Bacillus sp. AFS041924]PGS50628.1 rhodanese [Bacillus sp. AFS041924]
MELLNILIIVFIAYFIVQTFLPVKGVKQISTSDLKNELKHKEKQFIDVRTTAEYKGRNIKEFENIPLHLLKKNVNGLSKDKETIVICQSGIRSLKACKVLKKMGYTNITNVKGGMSAWS